jgi:hypothetical protein
MKHSLMLLVLVAFVIPTVARSQSTGEYHLALPDHKGQLTWSMDGFAVVENSAKPNGREIGVRGRDTSGQVTLIAFLFLAPGTAPLTGGKCRDAALAQEKHVNAKLKIARMLELAGTGGSSTALVEYTNSNRDGSTTYRVRAFAASNDICGDLEFYSNTQISGDDANLKKALSSYRFDPNYTAQFSDVVTFAQVLFLHHEYAAAAPLFGKGLTMVPPTGAPFQSALVARRVMRDQAGMSYGIAGDLETSRKIFEKGVADDPDYPMDDYNLACADAGEKNLADAKRHLKQAFDRKANVIPGEAMPVATEDDSFLPYKTNREFWAFLQAIEISK